MIKQLVLCIATTGIVAGTALAETPIITRTNPRDEYAKQATKSME